MAEILWDASALVKRYAAEAGSDTVDALFQVSPPLAMVATYLGYAEICATQRRCLNRGTFDRTTFTKSRSSLRSEVILGTRFRLITVSDQDMLAAEALVDQYNLNASDAAILAAYVRYARTNSPPAAPTVLVAADHRLVRAASAEGLKTLNPETVAAADIPAFLSAL